MFLFVCLCEYEAAASKIVIIPLSHVTCAYDNKVNDKKITEISWFEKNYI